MEALRKSVDVVVVGDDEIDCMALLNGGSGGGGSYESFGVAMSGAAGTANQGFAGGDSLANDIAGGGGGGAGAVGQDTTDTNSRFGGDGVATSISGSSTTYAGVGS